MPAVATRALFAATVALAASLVFLVQPMVAKQLLPTFGGTPSVWNTAVVFFQTALLAGYALAHVSIRRLGPRRQVPLQLALSLLVLAFVPFAVRASAQPPEWAPPAAWVAVLLAAAVGVPYLAVATASPVLQRWYAALGLRDSHDPYFLYSASNAGSLAGLLAFPLLLEPRLSTAGQERAWALLFVAYLACLAGCALLVRARARAVAASDAASLSGAGKRDPASSDAPIRRWQALRWVALAAVPSALMLGVTTYITTDIASAPLLWVVPLALYLMSFMVTFGRFVHLPPRWTGLAAAAMTVLLVVTELGKLNLSELEQVLVHLTAMFSAAVLAHSLLYADRPAANHLTAFYLLLSVGGALGGAFTALLAPALFDDVYEYPLLLAAVFAMRPGLWDGPRRWRERTWWRASAFVVEVALATLVVLVLGAAAAEQASLALEFAGDAWLVACLVALALLVIRRWGMFVAVGAVLVLMAIGGEDDVIHAERNFFGTLRVERTGGDRHTLLHGTTLHGTQFRDAERRDVPTTYYTTLGPLGDVFTRLQEDEPFVEVGAVGLGTGSVLGHARLWQRFTFFEIDPAVIRVARDPDLFTWVSDADVDVRIVEGDARLELADEPKGRFDLLVLDAYSSDAVPVHLLTVEAFELYLDRLAPDGVMVLHISSRHLALEPVIAANARELGLAAATREDSGSGSGYFEADGNGSHWIALARTPRDVAPLREDERWRTLVSPDAGGPWTDDHSDVLGTIAWIPAWLR